MSALEILLLLAFVGVLVTNRVLVRIVVAWLIVAWKFGQLVAESLFDKFWRDPIICRACDGSGRKYMLGLAGDADELCPACKGRGYHSTLHAPRGVKVSRG